MQPGSRIRSCSFPRIRCCGARNAALSAYTAAAGNRGMYIFRTSGKDVCRQKTARRRRGSAPGSAAFRIRSGLRAADFFRLCARYAPGVPGTEGRPAAVPVSRSFSACASAFPHFCGSSPVRCRPGVLPPRLIAVRFRKKRFCAEENACCVPCVPRAVKPADCLFLCPAPAAHAAYVQVSDFRRARFAARTVCGFPPGVLRIFRISGTPSLCRYRNRSCRYFLPGHPGKGMPV